MSTENQTPSAPDIGPDPSDAPPPDVRQQGKLGALFKKTSTKVIMGVLAAFMLIIVFGGKKEEDRPSNLGIKPPNRQQTDPNMIDPKIAQIQKDRDQRNAESLAANEQARNAGASYLPRVTNEVEDPLNAYARASVGQGTPVTIPVPPPLPPPAPAPTQSTATPLPSNSGPAKENPRYVAIAKAMKKALDPGRLEIDVQLAGVDAKPPPVDGKIQKPGDSTGTGSVDRSQASPSGKKIETKKVAGLGELFYATMDLEANSDYSKFVQATIIGGPFDGAKVQGAFKLVTDRLEIVFSKIAYNGKTMPINAIATNPENPEVGLATDVNYHYLQRFGGVFTAALVKGYGEALETQGNQVTVNADTGTVIQQTPRRSDKDLALIASGEAADELGAYFRSRINRPPTVIVAANTPIGVLLRGDLLEPLNALTLEQAPEEIPSQITPQPFNAADDAVQAVQQTGSLPPVVDRSAEEAGRAQELMNYAQTLRTQNFQRNYGNQMPGASP